MFKSCTYCWCLCFFTQLFQKWFSNAISGSVCRYVEQGSLHNFHDEHLDASGSLNVVTLTSSAFDSVWRGKKSPNIPRWGLLTMLCMASLTCKHAARWPSPSLAWFGSSTSSATHRLHLLPALLLPRTPTSSSSVVSAKTRTSLRMSSDVCPPPFQASIFTSAFI